MRSHWKTSIEDFPIEHFHWSKIFPSRFPWNPHEIPWTSQKNTIWLVVWIIFYFSIYWECHHPNWPTPSFFRGLGQPPASHLWSLEAPSVGWGLYGFLLATLSGLAEPLGALIAWAMVAASAEDMPLGERCYRWGLHHTVDGCEILRQLKTVVNIPWFCLGFNHPRWCRICIHRIHSMSNRQKYCSTNLVLLCLGLEVEKNFITDRGRPYTDTPFVIPPGILKSS